MVFLRLCGLAILLVATDAARAAMPMHFTHLGLDDGLTQNNVQAMLQDSQGYMWFATESGLNRFDGHEMRTYHRSRQDPSGLGNDFIWTIEEDTDGNLWLATKGGGVVRWNRDSDTFTSFRHDRNNPDSLASNDIRTLLVNKDGTLWVGTRDRGLDLFDPHSGTAQHFRHDAEDDSSLSGDNVYALYRDSKGQLWIGTDTGLNRMMPGSSIFHRYQHAAENPASLSSNKVRSIYEDSLHTIWVGTSTGGLNRLRSIAGEFQRFSHDAADPSSLSDNHVRVIFEDDARRLWVGTTNGLNLLHREDGDFDRYVQRTDDVTSLNDSYVNSIYQDRSGLLWIGTRSAGVSKWNPRSWSLGPYAQPWLADSDVTSFASDGRGSVWVGTLGAGLARIDESTGATVRFLHRADDPTSISDNRVMSLLIDGRGDLWIGTMAGGLNHLDADSGTIRHFQHDPENSNSVAANGVMSLMEDAEGRIWVGTYGAGVSVLDRDSGRFVHYGHDPVDESTLSDGRASVLLQSADGAIWVGTFGAGINLFDPGKGTFRRFPNEPENPGSLSENMVYAIHEDREGGLWVGTAGGGLDRVIRSADGKDVERFENLSRANGLPSDDVYGIQSDASGHLWLSTNFGLARMNVASGEVKTFHRSHGLQGEEFNFGAHHRGPDGRLYFGGTRGFNAFRPELVEESDYVPPVVLTSYSKLGQPAKTEVPLGQLDYIELGYDDRVVSLGFAALDFTAPARNSFAYQLEGFDASWIDLGNQRHVTLTNLDAGQYRLRVRAHSSDGPLSEANFEIPIVKAAAPWATSWAYGLYGMLVLSFAFVAWRSHRQKYLREVEYSQRLERDVAERTEQLERQNLELEVATRAKSDFLARMSHEIRTPMNGVLGMTQLLVGTVLDDKQRRFTQTIRSSAEALLGIINDILDFSKIEAGHLKLDCDTFDVNLLVEETADLFTAAAADKGLTLICSTPPGPPLQVSGDVGRLRQVLNNLIANAIKFTPDGEVTVHYSIVEDSPESAGLRFVVSDTGIGVHPDNRNSIFESFAQEDGTTSRRFGGTGLGLAICKQLVEMMNGEIGVESSPGDGARFWFTLTLPKARVAQLPDTTYDFADRRVLLVDSNNTSSSVVSGYLRALGMQVTAAYTGDSALRQLHASSFSKRFDLLLLDADIQGPDARKVIEATSRNPSLVDIKVVVMSQSLEKAEYRKWFDAGASGFLQKPVRQSTLADSLITTLECDGVTNRMAPLPANSVPGLGPLTGRVLLVEDNPVNQTVALGILDEFGCDTVVAFNGKDAVEKVSSNRFDVILMDCEMPVMDGFTATAEIRKRYGDGSSLPIIALTANAVEGDRERCLAAGMQDYMSKPITVEKLHGTLQKWLPAQQVRPEPSGTDAPLDRRSLDDIRKLQGIGGEKMVRRVIKIYLSSSEKMLANLQRSVADADPEGIRQAAHALKGSSQNVGAKSLAHLCQRLEERGKNGNLDGSRVLLDGIDTAYRDTVRALQGLVSAVDH